MKVRWFGMGDYCKICSQKICDHQKRDDIYTSRLLLLWTPCSGGGFGSFRVYRFSSSNYESYMSLKSAINNTIEYHKYLPLEDCLALIKLKEKLCNDGT